MPYYTFSDYPNREYDTSKKCLYHGAFLMGRSVKIKMLAVEAKHEEQLRQQVFKEFPELINHDFDFYDITPNIVDNLGVIKRRVDLEDFSNIVRLFSEKNIYMAEVTTKYSFSKCLDVNTGIFRFVFDQVSKGDMKKNPEIKASIIKKILNYLSRVEDFGVLSFIADEFFKKPLEVFTEQDYKRISVLPDYLLKSSMETVGQSLNTYLLEQKLATIPKKKGVKLLNPQDIQLSYYRLKSYLAPSVGEEQVEHDIPLEPLMYIDYNDICHLIHVYEDLVSKGYNLEKDILLAMINYIARTNYKIDVHTFGPQDFLALIVQGFMKDNGPEQRSPKVA
jgi:hypothetical protein